MRPAPSPEAVTNYRQGDSLAGRQVSEMAGVARRVRSGGGCGCAPSPRPPGGLPHGGPGTGLAGSAGGGGGRLRPGRRAVGRCQVEEMALRAPRGRGTEHFRSGPPVRRRLALTPADTNPQLIRHPMTRDGGGEAVRSALTRKRSPLPGRQVLPTSGGAQSIDRSNGFSGPCSLHFTSGRLPLTPRSARAAS